MITDTQIEIKTFSIDIFQLSQFIFTSNISHKFFLIIIFDEINCILTADVDDKTNPSDDKPVVDGDLNAQTTGRLITGILSRIFDFAIRS